MPEGTAGDAECLAVLLINRGSSGRSTGCKRNCEDNRNEEIDCFIEYSHYPIPCYFLMNDFSGKMFFGDNACGSAKIELNVSI